MTPTADLLCSIDSLDRWSLAWDALAVAAKLPYCAPAWMVSWLRHAAPVGARLRVAIVHEDRDLLGIAPFYVVKSGGLWVYRLLGSGTSQQREPLLRDDAPPAVAEKLAAVISEMRPRPDLLLFEGVPKRSRALSALERAWPDGNRPWVHRDLRHPAPAVRLTGRSFEDWLAARTRHFRKELQRLRRRLHERDAVFKLASSQDELRDGLRAFVALHHARWAGRGGSAVLTGPVERMLQDVARELGPDRFRLWTIESQGRVVSAEVMVAAGGTLSCWLGGFDPGWAPQQPSVQTLVAALEHAWRAGDERFELGPGAQDYKSRLADDEDILERVILVPRGGRSPLVRARIASRSAGLGVKRLLSHGPRASEVARARR